MLKKSMIVPLLALMLAPSMAVATDSPSPKALHGFLAVHIRGAFDGKNVSVVANGVVGVSHPLVDSVTLGGDTLSLLVTKPSTPSNAVQVHVAVIGNGKAENSNGTIFLNKSGFQKMSDGFSCRVDK